MREQGVARSGGARLGQVGHGRQGKNPDTFSGIRVRSMIRGSSVPSYESPGFRVAGVPSLPTDDGSGTPVNFRGGSLLAADKGSRRPLHGGLLTQEPPR